MTAASTVAPLLCLVVLGSAPVWSQSAPSPASTAATQPAAPPDRCAQIWLERATEFEQFLKTAQVASMKAVPVGVTRPSRAYFIPGGLAESMAWKAIAPGRRNGYFESYRSEIAAYEIDKLLELRMVPPTVERQLEREMGAAVLWASPTRSFKDLGGVPGQAGVPGPPGPQVAQWTRSIVRAKMFDNLIANTDPNLGNWLVDGDWHLILIDHSRSFTTTKSIVHKMDNIDRGLWDKMRALDETTLQVEVGKWMGRGEMRAILDRRDRMQKEIDKMVAERGESVFLRD